MSETSVTAERPGPAAQKPTALFPVTEYGEFFSLVDVAKLLQERLGLHPVFLFKSDYGALEPHAQLLERLNFSWTTALSWRLQFDARDIEQGVSDYVPSHRLGLIPDSAAAVPGAPAPAARSLVKTLIVSAALEAYFFFTKIRGWLERKGEGGVQLSRRPIFRIRRHYRDQFRFVRRVIGRYRPTVIVAGQDYPLSIVTLAAHAGAKLGVRTAIVPFSMTPTTKEVAESFFGARTNEITSPRLLRFARANLPNWLHVYRGRVYSRLSIPEAIASDNLGLTPPEPWTPNSGLGVALAPSQQGYDYCLSAGIRRDKIRLTGSLWSDRLIAQAETRTHRREALVRDILVFETYARNVARARTVPRRPDPIRIEEGDAIKPLLLLSWPPNQRPRKPFGFADADQLNAALAEMLIALAMSASVKIAVSLHPTLVGTQLGAELKRAGLYVIDKPLIEVVDCADVFCATVSSTLLWSLQAGVPSVNLDIYGYGYKEFREAGMCECSTLPELRAELLRLVEDGAYRAAVAERQNADRAHWTMPDGNAAERLVESVAELMRP